MPLENPVILSRGRQGSHFWGSKCRADGHLMPKCQKRSPSLTVLKPTHKGLAILEYEHPKRA